MMRRIIALAVLTGVAAGGGAWFVASRAAPVAALPQVATGAQTVRIVAFNAWVDNDDTEAAIRWIERERPDVLILSEAADRALPIFRGLAQTLPYRVSCRSAWPCSTVLMSRLPPVEAAGLARGDADNRRALSAAWARFEGPGGGFSVVGLHLSRPWPGDRQAQEVALLARAMAGRGNERLVVAGDFNAPGWSGTIRAITSHLGLERLADDGPTWPAHPGGYGVPPFIAIDHALVGPGWRAARVRRGPAIGSDHYPIVIDLVPRGGSDGR